MDKQMIEEMAKEMCGGCIENELMTCSFSREEIPCEFAKSFAESLFNAGYRKIPEGAGVLTKEEYNNMQFVTEFIGTKQKIGACDFNRVFLQHERKIRKETAEKLLNKVDYESNGQTKAITDLLRKEYGVETK